MTVDTPGAIGTASKDDQSWPVFYDRLQAFAQAPLGPARDALRNEIVRIAQRLKFNDKQTESLNKILDTPGEAGSKLVMNMIDLAKTRGQQQQELLKKMADDAYEFSAKQGRSIVGMASLYQTLASLARAFGMEDGAVYLENLATKDTVRAKAFLTDERHRLTETGQVALSQGYKEAFESLLNSNYDGFQTELGRRNQNVPGISPGGAPSSGSQQPSTPSAQPAARTAIPTIKVEDFRKNLVEMGIESAQIDRIIGKVQLAAKGGNNSAVDRQIERDKLPNALESLNDGQRIELYSRLRLPERQPS